MGPSDPNWKTPITFIAIVFIAALICCVLFGTAHADDELPTNPCMAVASDAIMAFEYRSHDVKIDELKNAVPKNVDPADYDQVQSIIDRAYTDEGNDPIEFALTILKECDEGKLHPYGSL